MLMIHVTVQHMYTLNYVYRSISKRCFALVDPRLEHSIVELDLDL
jgi:hypothetical protein